MKNCFGYVRVSTVKQGDGVSLEAQREAIEAFAARNDITICQWFEETVTAAKKGRPLFNKMVTQLKRRKANGVVFHKIDRSARNFADWARIGDLSEAGVDIHFATESLDFNSRGGRLTADIQAVIAADYVRNLREECIKGINGRLKQGLYPFKAPLGYLDNGGGKPKTIDPVRGPLVKRMFELYGSGEYSLHSLTSEMGKRGLTSAKGKPLSKTSIEQMLRNPFYTGIIKVRSGKIYQGIHKPLIAPQVLERVNAVRMGRDNKKSTKHNHRYRGLFQCGHCQGGMIPERQKGHVYYRCRKKGCLTKTIREEMIEEEMKALLKRTSLTDEQLATVRRRLHEWIEKDAFANLADHAQLELGKLKERLSRLTDKFIDDLIDQQLFNEKKQQLLLEQTKWENIAAQKKKKQQRLAQLDKFCELIKSLYFSYINAAASQKREIVKFASANRQIIGKKVYLEPSKWVTCLENVLVSSDCAPSSTSSRTKIRELTTLVDKFDVELQNSNPFQG